MTERYCNANAWDLKSIDRDAHREKLHCNITVIMHYMPRFYYIKWNWNEMIMNPLPESYLKIIYRNKETTNNRTRKTRRKDARRWNDRQTDAQTDCTWVKTKENAGATIQVKVKGSSIHILRKVSSCTQSVSSFVISWYDCSTEILMPYIA